MVKGDVAAVCRGHIAVLPSSSRTVGSALRPRAVTVGLGASAQSSSMKSISRLMSMVLSQI